jgi:3-oxoadipate CoA-transferase alpha subunit
LSKPVSPGRSGSARAERRYARRQRATQLRGTRMDKTVADPATAVAGIADGMTVMIGGFGGAGSPIELIHALIDRFRATGHPKDLTIINNNAGNGHVGLAALIEAEMVKKLICSFPRSADPVVFSDLYLAAKIDL